MVLVPAALKIVGLLILKLAGPDAGPDMNAVQSLPLLVAAVVELRQAQVKSLSFFTYLARNSAPLLHPHRQLLANSIVYLLQVCPDVPNLRKDLLLAFRVLFVNMPAMREYVPSILPPSISPRLKYRCHFPPVPETHSHYPAIWLSHPFPHFCPDPCGSAPAAMTI